MNKPESTSSFRRPWILLTYLILASFLLSVEAGAVRSTGNDEEKTGAIYAANDSERDLALTNSHNTRADRNLSKPKSEKNGSQPVGLPVKFVAPLVVIQRLLFANDGSLVSASAYYSQPRGRAPPYVS